MKLASILLLVPLWKVMWGCLTLPSALCFLNQGAALNCPPPLSPSLPSTACTLHRCSEGLREATRSQPHPHAMDAVRQPVLHHQGSSDAEC